VLQQLTDYLLHFRRISIPELGTIELVQQPATLDIANKLIYPPYYKAVFSEKQDGAVHQMLYLQATMGTDAAVAEKLRLLGTEMKRKMQQQSFTWTGIGTFEYNADKINFRPQELSSLLQPVPAHKVLREHVQHSVLVGDQMVLSDGTVEQHAAAKRARDLTITIGWIVALLAMAFIVYYLYQHGFIPEASGLDQQVEQKAPQPTYK
jgi:hypothetical protein